MNNWIFSEGFKIKWQTIGLNFLNGLVYILIILVIANITYHVLIRLLRRLLLQHKRTILLEEQKANTLFPLLRSIAFYVITFTVILHIIKRVFHFDTGTLLASASVLGVALGFGSQSLVKDIIGGFFILFENQFSVGEYVKAGDFSGVVEEIGIRSTRLRDWGGELHIVPNGSITAITNFNRGKMRAAVDIQVPYDEDLDYAMKVMHTVCEDVAKDFEDIIIEHPQVQGVIQFGERNAVIRVIAYTKANEQWELEREMRRRIHREFLKHEIRIPQPQNLIIRKEKKVGEKA